MSINLEKVAKLVRGVNSLISLNNCENTLDDIVLDYYISTVIQISSANFDPEELAAVKRDLTYEHKIFTIPGESLLGDYDEREWYTDKKDLIQPRFWTRYKNYLVDKKHFSPNVVSELGEDTLDRKLMNYIGNPNSEHDFLKRGLIIGDVQSGKTSTYIGLMCKAADAGYKVFILLTGTIESLRRQTQERVEEGIIGIDMSADCSGGKRVGVGLDNKDIFAMSMTSRKSDFVGNIDKIAVSLSNHDAVVFVIKKNTTVLKKLTDWLISLNADTSTNKINAPMLLIDDEADNASVNTSADKEDPTKINKLIRELVNVFSKSNYVGFTATPFANVFIDPETTDAMVNYDLFPEDFIVTLPTPSNYIGPSSTFAVMGKYFNHLKYVKDAGRVVEDGWPFYFKHTKIWDDELPDSLIDAMYVFYLANAIRDLRGDVKDHRSMLINISRFIAVQHCIKSKVEAIHNDAYRAIKYNLNPNDFSCVMTNPVLKRLYKNFEENYKDLEFAWENIAETIYNSIENIQIKVVNSSRSSEKLEYPKDDSLRVIAIGGLALSRGLTLEGLVVSFFFRNTSTYDVLMQMGRWFGYRKDYDDLFRIWTHVDSAKWYAEISESTDLLKADMSSMRELEKKPKDFGIRVRNNSNDLSITARNKMRNTTDEYEFSSYFGNMVETPYLSSSVQENKNNYSLIYQLVQQCVDDGNFFDKVKCAGEHYLIRDVNKLRIVGLIRKISTSKFNSNFDTRQISDFISDIIDASVDKWDVAFMDGNATEDQSKIVNLFGRKIYKVCRTNCILEVGRLRIGQRGKLGGPSDGIIGITDFNDKTAGEIIDAAKTEFRIAYLNAREEEFTEGRTYPSETWFKFVKDRKPLLIVYFIDVDCCDTEPTSVAINKFRTEMDGTPAVGFAIGFPRNDELAVINRKRFKANRKYNWFEQDQLSVESDEEE